MSQREDTEGSDGGEDPAELAARDQHLAEVRDWAVEVAAFYNVLRDADICDEHCLQLTVTYQEHRQSGTPDDDPDFGVG